MTWVDYYPVVILLGIMILVHELGHYWAAISVGIRVDTFSIGFGPRLFGFKRGETDFRVSAIPLGGYVRMAGEIPGDEAAADPRSFIAKARWQRAIVVIAGPLMNVILAIAIMAGLFMHSYPKPVDPENPVITNVEAGSAAARAGIETGDRILQIEGHQNPNWEEVFSTTALNAGHALPVVVARGKQTLHFNVTPTLDPKQGVGEAGWSADPMAELSMVEKGAPADLAGLRPGDLIGSINGIPVVSTITVAEQVIRSQGHPVQVVYVRDNQTRTTTVTPVANKDSKLPWRIGVQVGPRLEMVKLGPVAAIAESFRVNARDATLIVDGVRSLIERRVSPKSLQGPIQIARMSTEAVQAGAMPFFELMAMVSLNLAIINLLPIPILDGGTLLMLIIEMLMQREVSMKVKENAFKLGFVFLMMLMVFVIYNDLSHLFTHS